MRYLAAYLLLKLGGKEAPAEDDIKKVLGSVGVDTDSDKAKKVIDELKGKNVEELIAEGLFYFWYLLLANFIIDYFN